MTTEFYPEIDKNEKSKLYIQNLIRQQSWLIDTVTVPKLQSFLGTIKSIILYLVLNRSFKLPITSKATDYLKGVATRKSFKITSLNLQINKLPEYNHGNLAKLNLESTIELEQLKQIIAGLKFIIFELENLVEYSKKNRLAVAQSQLVLLRCNVIFLKKLNQIAQNLKWVNGIISNPMQDYLFPNSHLPATSFAPPLNLDKISIDMYLNAGEVYIELILLKKIVAKPWCLINKYNISFSEFLTKKFVAGSAQNINQLIEYYMDESHWEDFWEYSQGSNSKKSLDSIANYPDSHNSWFKNLVNFHHSLGQEYLNRNIQFNNSIYWIKKNLLVKIADPVLITVNIKLNSISNLVSNCLANLKSSIIDRDFLRYITDTSDASKEYSELLNQFFSTNNQDLVEFEQKFDLVSSLKNNQVTVATESYDSFDNLDVDFELLDQVDTPYEGMYKKIEEWDGELIKEISGIINGELADDYSCEFDT